MYGAGRLMLLPFGPRQHLFSEANFQDTTFYILKGGSCAPALKRMLAVFLFPHCLRPPLSREVHRDIQHYCWRTKCKLVVGRQLHLIAKIEEFVHTLFESGIALGHLDGST